MNIESLVSKAKQVCDNRGARFTPIREKVFRLLASAQGGVGAVSYTNLTLPTICSV